MQRLLSLVAQISAGPAFSLAELARRAGLSPHHLHRLFREQLQETPRQYSERLRLDYAASELLATEACVLEIALAVGYESHEVFLRAFRRRFGCTPTQYRLTARRPGADYQKHRPWAHTISRCLRLYHASSQSHSRSPAMLVSISRQERPAQPILFIQRRVSRGELQPMLAECFGTLFGHAMKAGLAVAGAPLARYLHTGPGLWTVEAVMPLAAPAEAVGEMRPGSLPGGALAVAVHSGPYETLPDTHAAVERWIEAQGLQAVGPPWESFVTDPGEHPDPKDWRTEVCWPLQT